MSAAIANPLRQCLAEAMASKRMSIYELAIRTKLEESGVLSIVMGDSNSPRGRRLIETALGVPIWSTGNAFKAAQITAFALTIDPLLELESASAVAARLGVIPRWNKPTAEQLIAKIAGKTTDEVCALNLRATKLVADFKRSGAPLTRPGIASQSIRP